jgi:hypothetical protein
MLGHPRLFSGLQAKIQFSILKMTMMRMISMPHFLTITKMKKTIIQKLRKNHQIRLIYALLEQATILASLKRV